MTNYIGRSTDTKPVTGMHNGSSFYEMDTGTTYYFDADGAEGSEWVTATAADADADA